MYKKIIEAANSPLRADSIKIDGKCANCHVHKGTENWIGRGSIMDYAHGNYSKWCKCCVIKAQLDYAIIESKRLYDNIPKLKAELEVVKCQL